MKKLTTLAILLLILSLVLAACSQPAAPAQPAPQPEQPAQAEPAPAAGDAIQPASEIIVYNWTEYIDPDLYGQFEAATGIRAIEDNFSSNEELLAKLQGGATGYAVIVPSDYTVAIMIEEGMLRRLDRANIPNLANLAERFKNVPYDPGNVFCAPYLWGTTGIGYDSAALEEAPTSWAAIFDPDPGAPWVGRMTLLDDPRESFGAALAYLGYSVNATDEAQLQEAKDLLIKAKAGLAGYDSDTYEDLVAAGENLLAHGWNGDFLLAQEENENVLYITPKEGGIVFVDNLCIPISATPEQKLAAEQFINFLLDPEIAAQNSQFIYYASPNQAAEAFLDPEFLEDPTVYPPDEVLEKLQYLEPVGQAESLYQRLWDEVKSAQ